MNKNTFSTFVSTFTVTAILLGFLAFGLTANAAITSSVSVSNSVRNISSGASEVESVVAYPNDTLELIIRVTGTNNANSAENVRVLNTLPAGLTYISGSTTLGNVSRGDAIVSAGLDIGSILPYQTKEIKFRARVNAPSYFSVGTTALTNRAYVYADNASTVTDTSSASVLRVSDTTVNPTYAIQLQQFGKDVSRGETTNHASITTRPNDTVEFVIKIKSNSTANLYNVIVRDILPAGLNYINNSTGLNNVIIANGITGNGINIGTLTPGQEATVRMFVTVNPASGFTSDTTYLTNTVQVYADNTSTAVSSMSVSVVKGALSQVSQVQAGPGETLFISLLTSAFVSMLYMAYATSESYKRKSLLALAKAQHANKTKFNFR